MTTFEKMNLCGLWRSAVLLLLTIISASAFAASASLSTYSLNVVASQAGRFTISVNDDASQRGFRWSQPSSSNISTAASAKLNHFRVRTDSGYLVVVSNGCGSAFGTVDVSISRSDNFVKEYLRVETGLSPADLLFSVGGGSGGGKGGGTGGGGSAAGTADSILFIEPGFLTINGDGGAVINVLDYTDASGAPAIVQSNSINRVSNNGPRFNIGMLITSGLSAVMANT